MYYPTIHESISGELAQAYPLQASADVAYHLLLPEGIGVTTTASNGIGIHASGAGIGITMTIKGSVSAYRGIVNNIGESTTVIGQTGTVTGGQSGIVLDGNHTVRNYGTITANSANGVGLAVVSGRLVLFNSGSINSGSLAVSCGGTDDLILNEGRIQGLIDLGAGNDTYIGKNGTFVSNQGVVSQINLGAGNDWASGGAGPETFYGGLGDDYLDGGAGADTVIYFGSNVTVDLSRQDAQDTGDGWDTLVNIENVTTGVGTDTLAGNHLANVLRSGANQDVLRGDGGNDTLDGGYGDDHLDGGAGFDIATFLDYTAEGEQGVTVNLARTDPQATGYGNDRFIGIEGLIGTSFADHFTGNGAANTLWGKGGNDTLDGAGGNDTLVQQAGDGNDRLVGGAGIDTVSFSGTAGAAVSLARTSAQSTAYGSDTYLGIENLSGGTGADSFTGNSLANTLKGNAGNDRLDGGSGNDALYGGTGYDRLYGDAGNDRLYGGTHNDLLYGGSGYDRLFGESGNDLLDGGAYNDSLYGGAGNDKLIGGLGKDLLSGGAGRDIFVFNTKPSSANVDRITDYNRSYDTIQLDNKYMPKLGGTGRLGSSKFVLGSKAKDADDHLIYDRAKGYLYYDADGAGTKYKQVLIAHFTNKALLNAGEFIVI